MPTELLFSYGTLQLESVQMATFGRRLTGTRDVLPGFEQTLIEIDDEATVSLSGKTHHLIAERSLRPSDEVHGTVFEITAEELAAVDRYEVSDYTRIAVILKSGAQSWVYVRA